jgi:tellurite resistance protein
MDAATEQTGAGVFVIIGIRPITRTTRRGTFHCPECGVRRPFARQRVQRRFTVFFVAMVPLDELGEYIECEHCRGTFRTSILDRHPDEDVSDFAAEFRPAVLRIMLLMMMVDGRIDVSEQRMILDLNRRLTGRSIPLAAIDAHLDAVRAGPRTAADYARKIAPLLNDQGKEMVLKAAFAVAVADHEVADSERTLLHEIGRALAMSAAQIRDVIAESTEAARQLGAERPR